MPESTFCDNSCVIDRIEAVRPNLTNRQTRIADYLTKNIDTVIFSTLAGLSRDCRVSEVSILKFAALLGYSGFSDMKRALQEYVRGRMSRSGSSEPEAEPGSDSASILKTVMAQEINDLRHTAAGIDPGYSREAVRLLSEAGRVFLFGSCSLFYLTEYFAHELGNVRDNVFALGMQTSALGALAGLREDDVFLCISMPRYPRVVTDAISFAAGAGVPTIAITDSLSSPLIPYATVPLLVNNKAFSYGGNTVPVLGMITALLNAVGAAAGPKSREILARNEKLREYFGLYQQ